MKRLLLCLLLALPTVTYSQSNLLVFQTDFGLRDGAVSSMKGVAMSVSSQLRLFDLTHEIPAYDIWQSAYRLDQTAAYWPSGTVFVSVVDPGVGSERRSVVLKTKTGHYFVGPDNGQFTLIAERMGIAELRQIDEAGNRRKESGASYTFHGRDVYAYTGARLASGKISLAQVGKKLTDDIIRISYQRAQQQGDSIVGNIPILDVQYGNVWTNIAASLLKSWPLNYGDSITVRIYHAGDLVYTSRMPYVTTFAAVAEGKELAYLNSLLELSFAINMGDFAGTNKIGSGATWNVVVEK